MNEDDLKQLIADGLPALKAGGRVAADAADEVKRAATNPELKSLLEKGSETSEKWRERIDQAMSEVGADGEGENPVLEAHYEVSRKIRQAAPTDEVRDLGIIAAGQLALHYWIAAFGTMAAYADQAGLGRVKQAMGQSLEEAKQADEAHSQLAAQIMS